MKRARRGQAPQRGRRRAVQRHRLQQERQTIDVLVTRWRLRDGLAFGFVIARRARANHRAGRTIGVARDFKLTVLMRPVFAPNVTAQRANVPGWGNRAKQRQNYNEKLREARAIGEPLARRQENHGREQC